MASYARKSTIIYVFSLLALISAAAPVYGGGNRQLDMSRADALIAEKEYDQAILILTDIARRNPDQFDQAHRRLRRIYQLRDEFNRTADDLIETLLNNPEDDDHILYLSRKLAEIENPNSPLLMSFMLRTREIAQFNVNRNQLRVIMERARALLDAGDGNQAINVYSGGMTFLRDEFFRAGYRDSMENDVRRETQNINLMLESFPQITSRLRAASVEAARAVNSADNAATAEAMNSLNLVLENYIELKQTLYSAAGVFNEFLDEIREASPETGDRNHLSFVLAVINGRARESIQEGMLGSFDIYWQNYINADLEALYLFIQRENSASLAALNAGDYQGVIASQNKITNHVELSIKLINYHRQFMEGGNPQTRELFGNTVLNDDVVKFLEIYAMNEANGLLRAAADTAAMPDLDRSSLSDWQTGIITTNAALSREQETRNIITSVARSINELIARANSINSEIETYHNISYIPDALAAIENLSQVLYEEERQSVQRYYAIAHNSLRNIMAARRDEMNRSKNLLEGNPSQGGTSIRDSYPSEALVILTSMLQSLTSDIENGNTILSQYGHEPQSITSNAEIAGIHSSYRSAVNELNAMQREGNALADTARHQISQSEAFRQEAERLFREAQLAFQRRDFDFARERLQTSSDRINSSLNIQANAPLRRLWDQQLLDLALTINRTENELIIAEVRDLINRARTSYFAGNFQIAEDNLIRARNRWRVTNSEENGEVIYWLGLIRTALSARTGRTIPPTAPLFPEMSQLLSQAQRNYEDGVRLIDAGQRTAGIAKFNEARQMTREVRLMFPFNQEAGILELRIEQYTDPAAFNASFEQRLRTAVTGTRQRSVEAFTDLQNLAEINPRYPNIRAIIIQAEIDMGYRPPPPNPADITRSRELTVSATRILDSNVTTLFETALGNLDEAIGLNPENLEATRIRDRLLSRMSVPGAIVLTSDDEEIFQRAMREFQATNYLVARALVDRLLQNPRNRNIAKVLDLQRRIQTVL